MTDMFGGEITFGDFDAQHCSSALTWVPLSKGRFFEFEMTGCVVSLKASTKQRSLSFFIGDQSGGATGAISDTGTSLLADPASAAATIAKVLDGQLDASQGLVNSTIRENNESQTRNVRKKRFTFHKNRVIRKDSNVSISETLRHTSHVFRALEMLLLAASRLCKQRYPPPYDPRRSCEIFWHFLKTFLRMRINSISTVLRGVRQYVSEHSLSH